MFNEKVYVFIWFWLLILSFLNAFNLVYWIWSTYFSFNLINFIDRHLVSLFKEKFLINFFVLDLQYSKGQACISWSFSFRQGLFVHGWSHCIALVGAQHRCFNHFRISQPIVEELHYPQAKQTWRKDLFGSGYKFGRRWKRFLSHKFDVSKRLHQQHFGFWRLNNRNELLQCVDFAISSFARQRWLSNVKRLTQRFLRFSISKIMSFYCSFNFLHNFIAYCSFNFFQ